MPEASHLASEAWLKALPRPLVKGPSVFSSFIRQ